MTGEEERKALLRVEKAAREVVRWPEDRKPKASLSSALRALDATRRN